jgi:hypothetical protein
MCSAFHAYAFRFILLPVWYLCLEDELYNCLQKKGRKTKIHARPPRSLQQLSTNSNTRTTALFKKRQFSVPRVLYTKRTPATIILSDTQQICCSLDRTSISICRRPYRMPNIVPKQQGDQAAAAAATAASDPVTKRYHAILRDFMAYTNQTGLYPEGHVFTDTELSEITPEQIIRYFTFKLYGDGDAKKPSVKPRSGSHHTLGKPCRIFVSCFQLLTLTFTHLLSVQLCTVEYRLLQKSHFILHATKGSLGQ